MAESASELALSTIIIIILIGVGFLNKIRVLLDVYCLYLSVLARLRVLHVLVCLLGILGAQGRRLVHVDLVLHHFDRVYLVLDLALHVWSHEVLLLILYHLVLGIDLVLHVSVFVLLAGLVVGYCRVPVGLSICRGVTLGAWSHWEQ